ncbi:MAG: hypothetical protein ACKOOA_08485, partial [Sediminibacterium sp.]
THSRRIFRPVSLTFLFHFLPNFDIYPRRALTYLWATNNEAVTIPPSTHPLPTTQRTTNPAGG